MDIKSSELLNARLAPSSITQTIIPNIQGNDIKEQFKLYTILKDKSLVKIYDLTELKAKKNVHGIDSLIDALTLIKDQLILSYKEDNIKNLTIRKTFDSISSALEILSINKIEISPEIINTILLAFLSKNHF